MISKASDLLELFIKEESRKLSETKMPHMPTLGSAYEEITKNGIDQDFILPPNLDLRVVSGFIATCGTMLPEQIDCMLVFGDGKKYGLTDQYIYEIDNVLCIFEVKKNLNKSNLRDAIHHLAKVRTIFADNFESKLIHQRYKPDISFARQNFARITGKAAPACYAEIHDLPKEDALLFYFIVLFKSL